MASSGIFAAPKLHHHREGGGPMTVCSCCITRGRGHAGGCPRPGGWLVAVLAAIAGAWLGAGVVLLRQPACAPAPPLAAPISRAIRSPQIGDPAAFDIITPYVAECPVPRRLATLRKRIGAVNWDGELAMLARYGLDPLTRCDADIAGGHRTNRPVLTAAGQGSSSAVRAAFEHAAHEMAAEAGGPAARRTYRVGALAVDLSTAEMAPVKSMPAPPVPAPLLVFHGDQIRGWSTYVSLEFHHLFAHLAHSYGWVAHWIDGNGTWAQLESSFISRFGRVPDVFLMHETFYDVARWGERGGALNATTVCVASGAARLHAPRGCDERAHFLRASAASPCWTISIGTDKTRDARRSTLCGKPTWLQARTRTGCRCTTQWRCPSASTRCPTQHPPSSN